MNTDPKTPTPDPKVPDAVDSAAIAEASDEIAVRHIFRWDLDKTYLHTDFDTIRDLIRTALQKPEEKVTVPGAVALLRELSRPDKDSRALVTFISGSPTQMRETLERKFEIDGIRPDAFILKPTLRNLLKGHFRAIRGQVGYKLNALLTLRENSPFAPETFFGDDAEQDAFIYSLYADIAAGTVDRAQLEEILRQSQVYEATAQTILARFERTTKRDTVQRIFIHLEAGSSPGRFLVFGPRLVPIANYFQAAVILYGDGVIKVDSVARVAAELLQHPKYDMQELAVSLQDLARRRHLNMDVLKRLAEDWRQATRDFPDDPDADAKARELRNTFPKEFIERFIIKVRALAPRNQNPMPEWTGPVDYLEVLRTDRAMRHSVQPK
ncbi:phosphatase domain-containing protein [Bradymonas sediminis]|uniref:Phosphatidate phosphatase APP1 catalytic domain-containing protein n=1 Tax=Bradymonas sediminis TaxID=1548548 RepID=A0A2Z4FH57_9DELT|nr:phosphatase domain-containing protein [Bradymonas sediminis]AWV88322.1 hypothetical protein DN745_02780 [Bradymonas sediminis]TDP77447.1 hypothetical protein DFR33_101349 [Bradymonas sediminis]